MGDDRFKFWLNVIVGPLIGGFAAYWIAASVLAEYSWCIAGEQHCVREWVSALSGWAAAVAAGATILFLRNESRRRDILEWREIVNSAELLRGTLWPQIEQLRSAIPVIDEPRTVTWIGPCLDKIEVALLDPENQSFRRASIITAAQLRSCLLMTAHCKRLVANAVAKQAPIDGRGIFDATIQELRLFSDELEKIRESAFNPSAYRGV
jgi:hypothetical protein